jgi:hypothetical protein
MLMLKAPTGAKFARIVLHLDPDQDTDRARRTFESHLARAQWMSGEGYKDLLQSGWPQKN